MPGTIKDTQAIRVILDGNDLGVFITPTKLAA